MKPPYEVTQEILNSVVSISEKLGVIKGSRFGPKSPELRKQNRIRTIQASLEIEGNTLSLDQVTAIFNHKRVLGTQREILEVQNAISAYEKMTAFDPFSLKSFCLAHSILMKGLVERPGKFRNRGAGISKGKEIAHIAPPAENVNPLLKELFGYLKKDKDAILIKSCVFHYEMEFIHPFEDGNGRMGRLWQTVLLAHRYPVFEFFPIETVIKERQPEYYRFLSLSDKLGHSTPFIEFMLEVMDRELSDILGESSGVEGPLERLTRAKDFFGAGEFSRKEYLSFHKGISTATASRDLKSGVDRKILIKQGDKRFSIYSFS